MENNQQKLIDAIQSKITAGSSNNLKAFLAGIDQLELLEAVEELNAEEQAIIFPLLPKDKAYFIFEQLATSDQHQLIDSFKGEEAQELVEELPPDDRVRLFDDLPKEEADKLLEGLSPKEQQSTNLLMSHQPQTAGRIMTTQYVNISPHISAHKALEKVKERAKEKETIYIIYVTDNLGKLVGALSLRELLTAEPGAKVSDFMKTSLITVQLDTDQEEVARLLQKLDLLAIPVVDEQDTLVGIVTVDDAMDILEAEATEDMLGKAGISSGLAKDQSKQSNTLINGSIWRIWRVRLPFLFLTLGGGLLAGSVIGAFEDVLEQVVFIAVFIPVIMGMGGNVGVQSSTIFLRGMILGHIREETLWRHILKEVTVGFSMGAVVGIIIGLIAWLWQGIPQLGLAIGLSLIIAMTVACFLGFMIPYLLAKLHIDQAAGTDPLITTIKDVLALLIYFSLVRLFLGYLL
ncbi:MAG: magnesium transporter [Spirochaetaceae bacterium]|nr:magnesium transporter [Spirochaetaceae bacterium]